MGVGYATAIRVGKEIVKRHKEYERERERKKAKAEGKALSPDELKKSGYRLADIDKSVILPPQVRKAARIAQAYFEPEGTGFKLLRAEKLAKELIRTLEGLW
jgi:superfamily I DNA and/or RNA helicase